MMDILELIDITPRAFAAYQAFVRRLVRALATIDKITPEEIPDEQAKEQEDGSLLVWIDLPQGKRVEFVIPKGDWAWHNRN